MAETTVSDLRIPDELTPELSAVLGTMSFMSGPIADLFRASGTPIPHRCEDEQAFVLHWYLKLLERHGPDWFGHAMMAISRMRQANEAAADVIHRLRTLRETFEGAEFAHG